MAEIDLVFASSAAAWAHFTNWKIYALHRGIAEMATDVDRALIRTGARLGENDK